MPFYPRLTPIGLLSLAACGGRVIDNENTNRTPHLSPPAIERVSVGPGGREANGPSGAAAVNENADVIAFESQATNLVQRPTDFPQIFVRDRPAKSTELISRPSEGAFAPYMSLFPAIDAAGLRVAFRSLIPLVPDDTNGQEDIFLKDRSSGAIQRVSVGNEGQQGSSWSSWPSIDALGIQVGFFSLSEGLTEDDRNDQMDVFVRDLSGDRPRTELISVKPPLISASFPSKRPDLSDDGLWVAFESEGPLMPEDQNEVEDIYLRHRPSQALFLISRGLGGGPTIGRNRTPSISGDGRSVGFYSEDPLDVRDVNDRPDFFVYDDRTGKIELVSIRSDGGAGEGESAGSDRVSYSGGRPIRLCGEGRFVAYESSDSRLVDGDTNGTTDVFVHDRQTRRTVRVSVATDGTEANASSGGPAFSRDCRWLAFESLAGNLIPNDTNGTWDVFLLSLDHFFPQA